MIFYPDTTLLPSPPYKDIEEVIAVLCDRCLEITNHPDVPQFEKEQLFELTMSLIDFWEKREEIHQHVL